MNLQLAKLLSPIEVQLQHLLLDPNNPRFSELGDELQSIAESRFSDEKVQQNTFEKMRDPIFDVGELRDTIKSLGFLPMDRIVVRKWKGAHADGKPRYVVIEGNRRITALKWLVNLHEIGKETFTQERLINFTTIEALLLDEQFAPESATLILPGLRHVSGVKEWGPYQKAKAVHALRKTGLSAQEAAQSLGLSTRAANTSYRCFLALEAMKSDEEYGEYADPKMYSYFEEIQKRPAIRDWLAWSDEAEKFTNEERLREFYSWITPSSDDPGPPKLSEARSVRELAQVISDEAALAILRSPEGSLSRALAKYEADHPEDWFPKILSAISALKSLTPDDLRKLDAATIQTLHDLKERTQQALNDRETLKAVKAPE